jgi:hypothetical protein
MAETHKIEIKAGKVKIEVTGIPGEGCKAATARLQSLGKTISDEPTPELYEAAHENQTIS